MERRIYIMDKKNKTKLLGLAAMLVGFLATTFADYANQKQTEEMVDELLETKLKEKFPEEES